MAKTFRTVVITGASSGIGADFAREVAPISQQIVLVARRQDLLDSLSQELVKGHGVQVRVIVADLAQPGAAEKLWEEIDQNVSGAVELFVNNAGFGLYGSVLETSLSREQEMVSLNVMALMTLSKLAAVRMCAQGKGHILNTASVAAFQPGPGMAVYFATKAFVLSYTEALDCELRSQGVRATALCPGNTATAFHAVAHTSRAKWMHRLVSSQPRQVARAGLQGVLTNQTVVVPGVLNYLMVNAGRLLPRAWVVNLSQRVLKT